MLKLSILVLGGALLCCCKSQQKPSVSENISKEALLNTWYLSSRNQNDQTTLVTDASSLPPARFREKLIFDKTDNTVSKTIPGPTDLPKTIKGQWHWLTTNQLILQFEGQLNDTLTIHQLDNDKFIFKP